MADEEIKVRYTGDSSGIEAASRRAGAALDGLDRAAGRTTTNFTGLSRVLQDAPFGFTAISNNLTQLLPAAGAAGLAISALTSAIVFSQTGLSNWTRGLTGATGPLSLFAERSNIISGTLKDATKQVAEQAVQLAVYKQKLNDTNLTTQERVTIAKQYNEIADKGNQIDLTQIGNIGLINQQIQKQNSLLLQRAISQAALGKIAEAANSTIETQIKLQSELSKRGFGTLEEYEKAQAKAQQAQTDLFRKRPDLFTTSQLNAMEKARQGLDGVARPAQQAGTAFNLAELEFNNLISSVKKDRAELDKLVASLSGIITVEGLSSKPIEVKSLKVKPTKLVLDLVDTIEVEAPDAYFKQLNEALAPKPTEFEKYVRQLWAGKQIPLPTRIVPVITIPKDPIRDAIEQSLNEAIQGVTAAGFSGLGEALGAAITGNGQGIADAFSQLGSLIGTSLQTLGKQMIALSPVIQALQLALKSLNPALLLPAGVGLVALGGALKNSLKLTGFAQGGLVPGTGNRDTVPALLTPGEVVVPRTNFQDLINGFTMRDYGAQGSERVVVAKVRGRSLLLMEERERKTQKRGA